MALFFAAAGVTTAPEVAGAASAQLDPGFGTNGLARLDFGGASIDRANAGQDRFIIGSAGDHMAAATPAESPDRNRAVIDFGVPSVGYAGGGDPYGSSTVVGAAGDDFAVARLQHMQPDERFGTHGRATISFGAPAVARAWSGGGHLAGEAELGEGTSIALARYDDAGRPDPAFGGDGRVLTDVSPGRDVAHAMQHWTPRWPHESGLLVAGEAGGAVVLALYRWEDGALVQSFGRGGIVQTDLSPEDDVAYAVGAGDDAIWIAGQAGSRGFVARYLPTGELDPRFGVAGVATVPVDAPSRINHLGGDGQNTVVVGSITGANGDDVLIGRLDASGNWNAQYGSGGLLAIDLGGDHDRATGFAWAEPDSETAVTGDDGDDMFMAVFDHTGAPVPDPRLPAGLAPVDFGRPSPERGGPLAVQPDGRIVVSGQRDSVLTVVRLLPDGSVDPSFRPGRPTVPELGTFFPSDVVIQPDGKILVAGMYVVARFLPSGELDPGFGDDGLARLYTYSYPHAGKLALQPDGSILLANDQLWRLTPSGQRDESFPEYYLDGVAAAVTREPDGRILVVSTKDLNTQWASFRRFDPNGTPMQSWNYGMWSPGLTAVAFARAPQGHMFLAGTVQPNPGRLPVDLAVAIFNPAGAVAGRIDADFGESEMVTGLVALPDGGFLLAVWLPHVDRLPDAVLAKYSASGGLDRAFGENGVMNLGTPSEVTGMALHGDGHVVVAGTVYGGADSDLGVFRVPLSGNLRRPVRAWGANGLGQLGDGTGLDRATPTTAAGLTDVTAVAAGGAHSLALRSDGTVWAWGANGLGQLGDGTWTDRYTPVRVEGLTDVVKVAAGIFHSLAVRRDGTVWAWGWNAAGQLGDGTVVNRQRPTRVPGVTGVASVAGGAYHTIVSRTDKSVWSWGWNGFGQLGDPAVGVRLLPARVALGCCPRTEVVAAGAYHSLVLTADGAVAAFGLNAYGQAGMPGGGVQMTPVRVVPGGGVGVAAGALHSMVLKGDGSVWAWGWNGAGQLGNGSTTNSPVPVAVTGLTGVNRIAAGGFHSLALGTDGTIRAWGWNAYGQLASSPAALATVPVVASTKASTLAGGWVHTLAV